MRRHGKRHRGIHLQLRQGIHIHRVARATRVVDERDGEPSVHEHKIVVAIAIGDPASRHFEFADAAATELRRRQGVVHAIVAIQAHMVVADVVGVQFLIGTTIGPAGIMCLVEQTYLIAHLDGHRHGGAHHAQRAHQHMLHRHWLFRYRLLS